MLKLLLIISGLLSSISLFSMNQLSEDDFQHIQSLMIRIKHEIWNHFDSPARRSLAIIDTDFNEIKTILSLPIKLFSCIH